MNLPKCSQFTREQTKFTKYKKVVYSAGIPCRCKGRKIPNFLKEAKNGEESHNDKFNGGADYKGGPGAKPCYIEYGKKSGMANPNTKPCPDSGRSTSKECSAPAPPPAKKKLCKCIINKGDGRDQHAFTVEGNGNAAASKTVDWDGKRFRSIECSGCKYVKVFDQDKQKHAQHVIMGKNYMSKKIANKQSRKKLRKLGDKSVNLNGKKENKSCCGKNKCGFQAPLAFWKAGHDYSDDVAKFTMDGAC